MRKKLQNCRAKGNFLHSVSAIPVRSILWNIGKTVVKKFRLPRVAARFVKEREKKGDTELYNKVDKAVEVRMLCRTSKSDVVQVPVKQTWIWVAREPGACTRTNTKSKEPFARHA